MIKCRVRIIEGKMGRGKTALMNYFQSFYTRVYSNVDFFHNGKRKNKRILKWSDIVNIPYNDIQGVLIIDEATNNAGQFEFASKKGKSLTEIMTLARKKRLDVFLLPQDVEMLLKNGRRLSGIVYSLQEPIYLKNGIIAKCHILKEGKRTDQWIKVKEVQYKVIGFSKRYNFGYNTLETSKIENDLD